MGSSTPTATSVMAMSRSSCCSTFAEPRQLGSRARRRPGRASTGRFLRQRRCRGYNRRTPDTVEAMAHGAIAFLEAMSLPRVDLLGFSIGSFIAQEIALIRPNLLRRVVLASSAPQGAAGMHGWAPTVIAPSVSRRRARRPTSACSSLLQTRAAKQACSHGADLRTNSRPRQADVVADAPSAVRRSLRLGHPQTIRCSNALLRSICRSSLPVATVTP